MLVVEVIGLTIGRLRQKRNRINKRLQLLADYGDRGDVLVRLRRERGLTDNGSFSFKMVS